MSNDVYLHGQPAPLASAKQLARLRFSDEKLSVRLAENDDRLDRFSQVLGNLEQTSATATRSPSLANRKRGDHAKKDRR
ncbi:MAG TPA: hypothetical protein VGH40_19445 [Roseiarcus sp.]|jgi:hypothetical protein